MQSMFVSKRGQRGARTPQHSKRRGTASASVKRTPGASPSARTSYLSRARSAGSMSASTRSQARHVPPMSHDVSFLSDTLPSASLDAGPSLLPDSAQARLYGAGRDVDDSDSSCDEFERALVRDHSQWTKRLCVGVCTAWGLLNVALTSLLLCGMQVPQPGALWPTRSSEIAPHS